MTISDISDSQDTDVQYVSQISDKVEPSEKFTEIARTNSMALDEMMLSCPAEYDPMEWAKLGTGNKKAYIYAMNETRLLTGGVE